MRISALRLFLTDRKKDKGSWKGRNRGTKLTYLEGKNQVRRKQECVALWDPNRKSWHELFYDGPFLPLPCTKCSTSFRCSCHHSHAFPLNNRIPTLLFNFALDKGEKNHCFLSSILVPSLDSAAVLQVEVENVFCGVQFVLFRMSTLTGR